MGLPIKILLVCAGTIGIVFLGGIMMLASQQWFLVNVETHGPDGVNLYVPVPVGLAYPFLPFIPEEAREFEIPNDVAIQPEKLQNLVQVLRDCPDGDFVRVSTPHETVRITKENDELIILVKTQEEDVDVRIPFDFFEEVLGSMEGNKFSTIKAASALATIRHSKFVSVRCPDANVTIWAW